MQSLTDMVMRLVPNMRDSLSVTERALAPHLRGNADLLGGLKAIIEERIGVRNRQQVPSDPMECKVMLERDRELQWLLSRLEVVCHSPVNEEVDDRGEPPA